MPSFRSALPPVLRPAKTKHTHTDARSIHVPVARAMVDCGVYAEGRRLPGKYTHAAALNKVRELEKEGTEAFVWIGLHEPDEHQMQAVGDVFGLHELAVEDAVHAHQRPKLERYDKTLFLVLKTVNYVEHESVALAREIVVTGEIFIFVGADFVVTVRHAESPDLAVVRKRLENDPKLLALGTEAVLYAILDAVVDGYAPVVAGLENDVDEIERQVFEGDTAVSRRIYLLNREVIDFQRAVAPLMSMLSGLEAGFDKYQVDEELRRSLRDVADHVAHVIERVDSLRAALRDILQVNSILVAEKQNEEMTALSRMSNAQNDEVKKISAWAAIGFAPTAIASIYGMNFRHMPELGWYFGYPFAIGLMILVGVGLYWAFKRRGWL